MGFITITSVTLAVTPAVATTVTVEYKLSTDPDSAYVVAGSGIVVQPNGDINPDLLIPGLMDGVEYTVRITLDCSGEQDFQTFQTGLLSTACADCSPTFSSVGPNLTSQIQVGTITSGTCLVGSYIIDWYKDSISGDPVFTSGSSAGIDPDVTVVHPITGEPAEGGVYYPVIRSIFLDGLEYTSYVKSGASYSPDLATCLATVNVENINCSNGPNAITGSNLYSHIIDYVNTVTSPSLASRSINFEVDGASPYFVWKFDGYTVSDTIKISYVSPLNSLDVQVEHWQVGQDFSPSSHNFVTDPKKIYSSEQHKITDLTAFPFDTGDYLRIDITPNVNSNTNWKFSCHCLDTIDCNTCDSSLREFDADATTMVYNTTTCTYDVILQRLYPCIYNTTNSLFYRYNKYTSVTSTGVVNGGANSSAITLQMRDNTTASFTTTTPSFGGCEAQIGSTTITKTGANINFVFANNDDYLYYKNIYNEVLTHIQYTSYNPDSTNLNYYKYFFFNIRNAVTCGDTFTQYQYRFHVSSPVTFDDINRTIDVTMVTGGNDFVDPGVCDTTFEAINAVVDAINQHIAAANYSFTTNTRYDRWLTMAYVNATVNEDLTKNFQYRLAVYGADVCDLAASGWTPSSVYSEELYNFYIYVEITNSADPINNFRVLSRMGTDGVLITNPANYILIYEKVGGVPNTTTTTTTTLP